MKGIRINYGDFYEFPEGITSIDEFVDYLNEHYHSFIKLKEFLTNNCCEPYFIESEWEWRYLNIAEIRYVRETEMHLLSKEEYERRLAEVVLQKCINCKHYEEDFLGDNLEGHRTMISLDGECRSGSPKMHKL